MTFGDIADVASLLGLVLIIGAAWFARTAREAARDAAWQVQSRLANLDMVAELSAAVSTLDEIKRLLQLGAWDFALDRYGIVRRYLVRVAQTSVGLSDTQRAQIGRVFQQFRIMEAEIARMRQQQEQDTLERGEAKLDQQQIDLLNSRISDIADILEGIRIAIRTVEV